VHPWDWTTRGSLLWYGDPYDRAIPHGRNPALLRADPCGFRGMAKNIISRNH
jgi:hypothetical protein